MTLKDAKRLTAHRPSIFWRAGADSITELTVRQANKLLKNMVEDGVNLDTLTFRTTGGSVNSLYIDEKSWVEYHESI